MYYQNTLVDANKVGSEILVDGILLNRTGNLRDGTDVWVLINDKREE